MFLGFGTWSWAEMHRLLDGTPAICPGMDPKDRGQQRLACLCPHLPKGPLSAAPSWLSPLRNLLLGAALFVCGHMGSPHLDADRTGDAAFVQGNTDGNFYGGQT